MDRGLIQCRPKFTMETALMWIAVPVTIVIQSPRVFIAFQRRKLVFMIGIETLISTRMTVTMDLSLPVAVRMISLVLLQTVQIHKLERTHTIHPHCCHGQLELILRIIICRPSRWIGWAKLTNMTAIPSLSLSLVIMNVAVLAIVSV